MPVERREKTGPELVDERLAYSAGARETEGVRGEAGLEHLRRSVAGVVVPSYSGAHSLTEELSHMRGIRNVNGVEYRGALKRKHGHYDRAVEVIVIMGTPRLATVLHEWAHHAVLCRYATSKKSHGREFKAELRWAYRAIESVTALDLSTEVRAAAMGELREEARARAVALPRFSIGDRVRVKGLANRDHLRSCGAVGHIEQKLRKNYVVAFEVTRGPAKYRVPPGAMEKV